MEFTKDMERVFALLPYMKRTSTLPILGCVMLAAREGKLVAEATDLETYVKAELCDAKDEDSIAIVDGPLLAALAIEAKHGSYEVAFSYGKPAASDALAGILGSNEASAPAGLCFRSKWSDGTDGANLYARGTCEHADDPDGRAKEFPNMPLHGFNEVLKINRTALRDSLRFASAASSTDDARPTMTSVYFKSEQAGQLRIAATDGFQLNVATMLEGIAECEEPFKFILALRSAERLLRILALPKALLAEDVTISVNPLRNQVLAQCGKMTMVGQCIDANYPRFENIIPGSNAWSVSLTVIRSHLRDALRIASAVYKPIRGRAAKGVVFERSQLDDRVMLHAASFESGFATIPVPCTYKVKTDEDGNAVEVADHRSLYAAVKYFDRIMATIGGDAIDVEWSHPYAPITVHGATATASHLSVIMPLHRSGG